MASHTAFKSDKHKSQALLKNPECEDSVVLKKSVFSCFSEPRAGRFCPFLAKWLTACWSLYHSRCAVKKRTKKPQKTLELSLSEVSLSTGTHTNSVRPLFFQPCEQTSRENFSTFGLTLPVESRREMSPPPDARACPSNPDRLRGQHIVEIAPAPWERDVFLRVELWDMGLGCGKPRYRVEWEITDGFKQLGAGVWLSRIVK